jgi:hypothetical protein
MKIKIYDNKFKPILIIKRIIVFIYLIAYITMIVLIALKKIDLSGIDNNIFNVLSLLCTTLLLYFIFRIITSGYYEETLPKEILVATYKLDDYEVFKRNIERYYQKKDYKLTRMGPKSKTYQKLVSMSETCRRRITVKFICDDKICMDKINRVYENDGEQLDHGYRRDSIIYLFADRVDEESKMEYLSRYIVNKVGCANVLIDTKMNELYVAIVTRPINKHNKELSYSKINYILQNNLNLSMMCEERKNIDNKRTNK